jgi:hemolysin activation/secretion protein
MHRLGAACTLLVIYAPLGLGQVTAPGQIEKEFQTTPRLPAPQAPVQPPVEEQKAPQGAENVRLTLKAVVVEGSTVYKDADLRPLYAQALGKEISLADVFVLANDMTSKYRNDGYVLSQVLVPTQNIKDGVVRLKAVEGFVAQTRTQGKVHGPPSNIEAQLERIRNSRPLSASVLERNLLLMNDLPGVTGQAVLSPSRQADAADLDVALSQPRADLSVGINNRGSRSLGPGRVDAALSFNSLFWGYDRLGLRAIQTIPDDELTYVSGSYERVLNSNGLKLTLNTGRVDAKPQPLFQNFLIPTNSTSAAAGLEYPFIRSRITNLTGRASVSYFDGRTDTNVNGSTVPLNKDNVRAARVGFSFDTIDRFRAINLLDFEVSQGLNTLNASDVNTSPPPTRVYAKPDFTKATLYAARLQSIAPKWSVLAAVSGQYAFSSLPVSEQFSVGGEQFGRGYDPAELLGDSGGALKFELRFTGDTSTWLRSYMLYGFYDIGEVYSRATPGSASVTSSLASTGLGVRVTMRRFLTGFVEVAQPLTKTVNQEGNKDARLYAGLQAVF